MQKLGTRLGVGIGAALIALTALYPIPRIDEANATGEASWIGVSVRPLTERLREQWDYRGAGVMVTAVAPGSPADVAGIVSGDVLVVIGTVSLASESDFAEAQARVVPEEPISVVVARDKGRIINIVNLEFAPVPPPIEKKPTPAARKRASSEPVLAEAKVQVAVVEPAQSAAVPLGVRCEPLSTQLATALGVTVDHGVMVLATESGSPADLAGIRAGDVISRAGDEAVHSMSDLDRMFAAASGSLTVRVHRQGDDRKVVVRLVASAPSVPVVATPSGNDDDRDQLIQQLRKQIQELRHEIQKLRTELEGMKTY